MHPFEVLQDRLREEGWYVEWALPCCQSCAWAEVPFEHEVGPLSGEEVNLDKVLFNHEQDCEDDSVEYDEDADVYLSASGEPIDESEFSQVPHVMYTEMDGSYFCFSGVEKGVQNLIDVLPIIEECGCSYTWSKTGETRIYISWNKEQ